MTEIKRKRLLYQAQHRGMNENDILLGGFARKYMAELNDSELDLFEALLEEWDADILYWLTGKAPVPALHDTPLWAKIMAYVKAEK